jgi:anti-sigma-K factor RskA
MSEIDIHHLAAAYALDALDERERAEFEAHYESCEICRADVVAFRSTMAQVGEAYSVPPPSSMKDRVMADIAATRQLSPTLSVVDLASRRRTTWILAAAAALVLIVVSVVALAARGDEQPAYAADLARVMEQPDAQMLHLDGAEGAEGSFMVAWSDTLGEAVLIGEDLPPAPDGMAYELWWFPEEGSTTAPPSPNEDGRMAMYVLDSADDHDVHQSIEVPESPAAWAITLEPAGGSAVTTGDVMFVAAVA